MKTYTLEEAGKCLPELTAEAAKHAVAIVREDQTKVYLIDLEQLGGMPETWEILNDPGAMEAIREEQNCGGKGEYQTLEEFEAMLDVLDDESENPPLPIN